MNHYLFRQLAFARACTLRAAAGLNEEQVLFQPEHFNNNIKWNLGHIYFANERFAYFLRGEAMHMPEGFAELFGTGSKPADWAGKQLPSLEELLELLQGQLERIERDVEASMKDSINPYTTSTGLTISTVEEALSFCLYHEAMHFDAIKAIKRSIGRMRLGS